MVDVGIRASEGQGHSVRWNRMPPATVQSSKEERPNIKTEKSTKNISTRQRVSVEFSVMGFKRPNTGTIKVLLFLTRHRNNDKI